MEELTLSYIITIFRRHRKSFWITCLTLLALANIFALSWSNYRSTATVMIERPEIPPNLTIPNNGNLEDAIVSLADQHISEIQQNVTSLNSLSDLIAQFNLYPEQRKSGAITSVADTMRSKIKLEFISSQLSNPVAAQKETAEQLSAIAFTLSFDYSDPETAQKVNTELVRRFIDEDTKGRHTKSQETSAFLDAQISALEKSMAEQEKKIADFKSKYGETGPTALIFNQQASVTTALDLQNIQSQITANEGTQGSLRAQLATIEPYSRVIADGQVLTTPAIQLKALEAQYATVSGQYGPDYPDVIKLRNQIQTLKSQIAAQGGKATTEDTAQLKAQINDVRTNLAAAESKGGPENPDVIALKYKLSGLEKRLAATPESHAPDGGIKSDADNPAYLSLVAQLRSAEEQHKSLLGRREALLAQQDKYQRAIAENPDIEKQMSELSRDYENAQLRYRELKEKKMAADMSGQLVDDHKGQRLSVINPPSLPTHTHPSRLIILLAGLICSLLGGTGTVIIKEALDQSIYGQQHLTSIIGAAPMATIPYIYTQEEGEHRERIKSYGVIAGIFTAILTAAFIVIGMPAYYAWNFIAHLLKLS